MTAISDLLKRVEAATEADRALDHAIYEALKPTLEVYSRYAPSGNMDAHWYWMASREYTGSIDAAIALVERALGHAATVAPCINIGAAQHSCSIHLFEREEPVVTENLRTPALAILAALLRALEQSP
jgi:hypothetical protein